ncbi:hypothetical protein ACQY1Q_03095 [Tenacibaculum sp. TC6]|uniref:hypothetical protein n=1 Tax=Tenacibaculum sp. TC6 TaxID=3423223 RepID=UPI003D36D5F3
MEVTDLQGNKTYSILLPLKNTSDYEFYNWGIEQKSDGTLSTPFVKKYTTPHKKTTLHKVVNNIWTIKTYRVSEFLAYVSGNLQRASDSPCSEVTIDGTTNSSGNFYFNNASGEISSYFSSEGNLIKNNTSYGSVTGVGSACYTITKTIRYNCNGPNGDKDHSSEDCGDASSGYSGTGTKTVTSNVCTPIIVTISNELLLTTGENPVDLTIATNDPEIICDLTDIWSTLELELRANGTLPHIKLAYLEELRKFLDNNEPCTSEFHKKGTTTVKSNRTEGADCPPVDEVPILTPGELTGVNGLRLTSAEAAFLDKPENLTFKNQLNAFLIENNNSEEAEKFASKAIKTLMEKPNYVDDIINNTNNPCVTNIIKALQEKDTNKAIVPDLAGASHLSQMVLDLFGECTNHDLEIKIAQLGTNSQGFPLNAKTDGIESITLDIDLVNDATQLSIAKTLIHESLHAFINLKMYEDRRSGLAVLLNSYYQKYRNNYPHDIANNLTQHKFMAEFVEALAYSLSAYDNHRQPMDYYKAMAWGGLESSDTYKALDQDKKDEIQKIINNERYAKNDAKSTKCS